MTSIGLPVPAGFTCTTECCDQYYKQGRKLPAGLMDQVHAAIKTLENENGKKFGSNTDPLLVSVRSGAAQSMPGMMDTVLNLGLNDESVVGLANATGNERFAYDAYRRLLNMYGDVVMGVDHHAFESEFDKVKKSQNVNLDTDVDTQGLDQALRRLQKNDQKTHRQRLPPRRDEAAGTGHHRRVQLVDGAPCDPLSSDQRDDRPRSAPP